MYHLKKVAALTFLAIQIGVLEYAIFRVFSWHSAFEGWYALMVTSFIGFIFWFILLTFLGNGRNNDIR